MAATTTLLGLVTPTQGTLSGTWGDTVNYGISDYVDISVAGTLTLTNDGAVTLANTTGSSSGNSITSSLTGAGTVTAQFAIVRVTGTLTVAKVVTGPSYSKTYTVVNAATGGIVTFKASGQTGVSVAVGESAFVYYNGTDYVKVSGTVAVASFQTSLGGLTPSTATTGVVTLAGTLNTTSGGTGLASYTAGDLSYYASGTALTKLAIGTAGQFLTSTGTAPQWSTLSGVAVTTFSAGTTGFTPSSATSGAVTLAGTLATTNGGTGLTSFTSGGVVYASSTSALVTGNGLTFDGTGNLTCTGTVTGNSFTAYSNSADGGTQGYVGNARALFGTGVSTTSLGVRGETNILFGISSTEAMRLTSTSLYTASGINVGIGTSSTSSARLTVAGVSNTGYTSFLANGTGTAYNLWRMTNTGGDLRIGIESATAVGILTGTTNYSASIGTLTATDLQFGTNSTVRATIDSVGNLGLGVTPSAWSAAARALQIGSGLNGGAIAGDVNYGILRLYANAYYDAGDKYVKSGEAASTYEMWGYDGTHIWKNAPVNSGSAGAACTFTSRMTLDASGNLGIGTSSPTRLLDVNGAARIASGVYMNNGSNAFIWQEANAAIQIATNNAERMRIDSSGNVQIGTATSAGADIRLTIYDNSNSGQIALCRDAGSQRGTLLFGRLNSGTFQQTARIGSDSDSASPNNGVLYFQTSDASGVNAERMRLTGAGNLCIGTTSSSVKLRVESTDADFTGVFRNTNASGYGLQVLTQGSGSNLAFQVRTNAANTNAFQVLDSGNVGIGTSSPTVKLEVDDGTVFASGANRGMRFGESNCAILGDSATASAANLVFYTGNAERARILAAGGIQTTTTISVGNATPSTSGAGITFPATQSASSNANTLDDYEEGTWTPTDNSGAGLSLTVYDATYTKIGRVVEFEAAIYFPSTASTALVSFSGLPFTAAGGTDNTGGISITATDVGANYYALITRGTTNMSVNTNLDVGVSNAVYSSKRLKFFGIYHV